MSDKFQGGVKGGATSVSLTFVLRKTADSTEQTGKLAADMTLSYIPQGGTSTAFTASDLASVNSAWSAGGVKEIDSSNMPGAYRVDIPNAAFAAGADWVEFAVKVASCFVYHERIPITSNVIQTGDAFARLGAPAGASTAADIAAIAGKVWDENLSAHTTTNTFGGQVRTSTAQAGAAGTITLDAGASATDNFYNNDLLVIVSGSGAGQARFITGYVGATKIATMNSNWKISPDNTSVFKIYPFDAIPGATAPTASQVATAVWQDLTSSGDFATAGSVGALLKNDIDAAVSSRLATSGYTVPDNATIASIKGDTGTILTDVNTGAGAIFTRLGAPTGASIAADIAAVETHAASIDTKVGTPAASVSADIAAIKAVLPTALSGNGNIKADVLELNGDLVAAANIAKTTRAIARGTVNTGATTTSIPTSAFTPAGAALDQFKGRIVTFDADTTTTALRGQSTDITGSSNSATPTLTVSALSTSPASGDTFSVT